ncbi:MAG: glycosyl transferase family 2 [Candidatus Andersenbacteria bacterium CG10_big_fil_rev_8_21_14_0_10_54_11]|uniref:Glycosyl transferase family 2 n=1 Tax=Candidatus Andersenbacteria bacterium CG10_big_fil_rev_8_21_14_0_10_54_11 TaxID=1974485 RepID=A0A2M6WYE5_9BACT|nr:MAG: glycosyl transferase family 2 [Candidatus Andersenbacteria bacterium CG10_big_fil_rev_8_21_14_0_10_54_11]
MKLSIIIINYNSGALTRACIASILQQELPFTVEIIVVDNASADESVSLLRDEFPDITVIANDQNRGFGAGVNQGLTAAHGSYILILNPDIVVLPEALPRMVQYMNVHPDIGVLGAQLIYPNGHLQYSCFRFYTPMTIVYRRTPLGRLRSGRQAVLSFLMQDVDHQNPIDVDWLMGSCLLLRAAAVRKVGGMDERFFMYFEDVDWCRRMWEFGWRVVYFPHAQLSHYHQRSSDHGGLLGVFTNWTVRAHITSALKYFWKYRGKKLPHRTSRQRTLL